MTETPTSAPGASPKKPNPEAVKAAEKAADANKAAAEKTKAEAEAKAAKAKSEKAAADKAAKLKEEVKKDTKPKPKDTTPSGSSSPKAPKRASSGGSPSRWGKILSNPFAAFSGRGKGSGGSRFSNGLDYLFGKGVVNDVENATKSVAKAIDKPWEAILGLGDSTNALTKGLDKSFGPIAGFINRIFNPRSKK